MSAAAQSSATRRDDAGGPDASYELLRFLSRLGHALLATGDTVALVEDILRRVALAHGVQHVNVVALPTALFVKFDDGRETIVDFTSEEGLVLRFDQIAAVFALAQDAERHAVTPGDGLVRLRAILAQPPLYPALWGLVGHVLATIGLALVLQPRPGVIGAAAFFGLIVGILKLLARPGGVFSALLPSIAAFVVAAIALLAVQHGFAASPLAALVASLVTFLPGGMLAIAIMELAYGDIVSGGSRFVTGLVQLMFLALGMLAATALVGLPAEDLLVQPPDARLGAWAPWLGVLAFAVGHALHFSMPLRALPWLLGVLAVAQLAQSAGGAAFGGYMSGFFGALGMTPVAYFMQYRLGGPPAVVTFPPALWLLVPGSLGLMGLTELAAAEDLAGLRDFVTTLLTITAIALGTLIGAGIYNAFFDPILKRAGTMAQDVWQRRWRR